MEPWLRRLIDRRGRGVTNISLSYHQIEVIGRLFTEPAYQASLGVRNAELDHLRTVFRDLPPPPGQTLTLQQEYWLLQYRDGADMNPPRIIPRNPANEALRATFQARLAAGVTRPRWLDELMNRFERQGNPWRLTQYQREYLLDILTNRESRVGWSRADLEAARGVLLGDQRLTSTERGILIRQVPEIPEVVPTRLNPPRQTQQGLERWLSTLLSSFSKITACAVAFEVARSRLKG